MKRSKEKEEEEAEVLGKESKEADTLLTELQRDFYSRRCGCRYRSKLFALLLVVLVIVLVVLVGVSLLTYKSIIYPPTELDLCPNSDYVIIPLGTHGGITEDDLSSFLFSKKGSPYFLALDAGNIFHGLSLFVQQIQTQLQQQNKYWDLLDFPAWADSPEQQTGWLMKNNIVGYFIGHPHLDHLLGLMAVAPEDYYMGPQGIPPAQPDPKSIIGLQSTLSAIESDLFNGLVWADFVKMGRYTYQTVSDGMVSDLASLLGNFSQGAPVAAHDFPNAVTVTSFQTCHDALNSTAFLFSLSGAQVLFFSDTGVPSSVPLSYCNWTERIAHVWASVDLRILKAIIIEVSFPNFVPDSGMYGHLRPKDLMQQLHVLAAMNQETTLSGLTVVVQHIKPILNNIPSNQYKSDARAIIQSQLESANDLDINFVFPIQGKQVCV